MIYPTLFFKHVKVHRAIRDYPLYDVPNKQEERTLDEAYVQENFAYFMRVRHQRLVFFQNWLHRWFGVRAPLNGDGLLGLNEWVNAYGSGLIRDERKAAIVFATYHPAWAGEYAGCNVIVDIAIFIGEYLMSERPRLEWDVFRGRPHVGGYPPFWGRDVFCLAYGGVADARKMARIGHGPVVKWDMIDCCKTWLALPGHEDHVLNCEDTESEAI